MGFAENGLIGRKETTFFKRGCSFVAYCLFSLIGCVSVISKQLRKQVAKELTLQVVLKDPDAYKGKTVLWSGVIISSVNLKEGTMIEVLQKPADTRGKSKDVDESEGRFLTLHPAYLDVAIYNGGRKVTVAGEVQGKKIQRLGEIDYTYPLILVKEIHLWPVEKEDRVLLPLPFLALSLVVWSLVVSPTRTFVILKYLAKSWGQRVDRRFDHLIAY